MGKPEEIEKAPQTKPIGENGKTLVQMLADSNGLMEDTGHYCGVKELTLKTKNPIHYEKLWSRLRGALVGARETALNISASPIVREIGELCFALYTPEGDSITLLDRHHGARAHHVGSHQAHCAQRLRKRSGDTPRRHFCEQRPTAGGRA